MKGAEKRERLAEENTNALLFDDLDDALIGISNGLGRQALGVYDYDLMVEVFIAQGYKHEEAVEHVDFNIVGAWLGPMTPIVVFRFEEAE